VVAVVIVESRDLDTPEDIPVEIRARVEANALFDALRSGDYAGAALAQERLRALGWYVTREPVAHRRGDRRKPSPKAPGRGVVR
jgi:hypothetical protein